MFVRDHDRAFTSLRGFDRHERIIAHLHRTEKFSRTFVSSLQRLDEPTLRGFLCAPHDACLLTDEQVAGVLDRRETLLSYIAALLAGYGPERVFVFP
jgi:hypothetical protein